MIKKADRVRLKLSFVETMTYKQQRTSKKVNWVTRVGTVISANSLRVSVKWDDRKSKDEFDPRVLEVIQ